MACLLHNRLHLAQFYLIRSVKCSEDGSRDNLCVLLLSVVVSVIINVDMILLFFVSLLSFVRKLNPHDPSKEKERTSSSSWPLETGANYRD